MGQDTNSRNTALKIIFLVVVALVAFLLLVFVLSVSPKTVAGVGKGISPPPYRQWTVALLRNKATPRCCGGVLITCRHLLTAAHCVDACMSFNAPITVRLNDDSNANGEVRHMDYTVKEIKSHEDFDRLFTSKHDIAILVLEEEVPGSIPLAPLPPAGPLYAWQEATVTGLAESEMSTLEEIPVMVWDNSNCSKIFKASQQMYTDIFDTFLCASSLPGEKSMKKGYGGEPLQLYTPSRGWEVVEIVSWGLDDWTNVQYPIVYTRVNRYIDWINNTIHSTTGDNLPPPSNQ